MEFPKENIIDNWLDKNSNPKINLYIKFKIMSENLKYSFYNNWKLYILLTLFGLMLIGWFGGCPREKATATVEVTIPATTGKMEAVKPKQEVVTKKDNHIVGVNKKVLDKMTDKEREFFQFQLDSLISLTTAYEKEFIYSDSIKKNNLYKDAIQLKSFNQSFENDKIKINASGLVRGTIESIGFDYEIKEQKINVEVPKPKETFLKMNAGANIGINKELNQLVYGANVSFEGKKGNAILLNSLKIKDQDYYSIGYSWKIFDWKRERKK